MKTNLCLALMALAGTLASCNSANDSASPIAPGIPAPAVSGYSAQSAQLLARQQKGELTDAEFIEAKESLLGQTIFALSELDQPPVALDHPNPRFHSPLPDDVTFVSVVDYLVDAAGTVRSVHELTGDRTEFGRAWVRAVGSWRYLPGRKDGQAVVTHLQVRVRQQAIQSSGGDWHGSGEPPELGPPPPLPSPGKM
jgi:hypothetical protein